jgi:hypothetical protein
MTLSCDMILSRKLRKILKSVKRIRMKEIGQPQSLEHLHSNFSLKSSGLIMRNNKLISRLRN